MTRLVLLAVPLLLISIGFSIMLIGIESCKLIYGDPRLTTSGKSARITTPGNQGKWRFSAYLHANDTLSVKISVHNLSAMIHVFIRIRDAASGRTWSYTENSVGSASMPAFIAPTSSVFIVDISINSSGNLGAYNIYVVGTAGSRGGFKGYYLALGSLIIALGFLGGIPIARH